MAHIPERRKNVRRKDEEPLRKGEEKYRNILESIEEGYYEEDLKGNFTFFNNSMCRIYGYSREELMGMNYRQYTDKETAKNLFQVFNEIYKTGNTSINYSYELIRKDGAKRYIEASASVKKDSLDKPIGFRGIIRDVTIRREAEEALGKSEEKYRNLLDNASDAILLANDDGNLLEVNKKAEELLGYTRQELWGVNIVNIHPPEEMEKTINGFKKINQNGLGTVNNTAVLRKDGKTVFVDISGSVIEYSGKKVLQGIFRDITERKKMEETLRQSEERYRSILESIREGYFELDLDGNYIFTNEANCRYLGYTKEELIGMNYRRHTDEETAKKLYQPYYELYRTGKPIEILELEAIRKDGTKAIYETSVSLIRDSEGKPIGFRGVSRDITARKLAEEELYRSQQMLQLVLDNIPQRVFWKDRNYVYRGCNKPFMQDAGLTSMEEIIGKDDFQLSWKKTALLYRAGDKKVMENNITQVGYEEPQDKPDGSQMWLRTSKTPLHDRTGHVIGILGTYEDITEQKRAAEITQESEERFRLAFENTNTGMCLVDLKGNLARVNNKMCEIFGYTKEELEHMTVNDIAHPDDIGKSPEFIQKSLQGKIGSSIFEKRYFHKKGDVLTCEVSSSLIRNTAGAPLYFISHIHDVTERKRIEEALRESEEKYRHILENMEEGYFEIDLVGNFTFVNNAECRNLGYTKEELIGMNNRQYQNEATIRRMYQIFNNMYKTGEPIKVIDIEIIRKDGTKKFNEISVSLIRDSKGKKIGFSGVSRDITERKRAEDALKKNSEELIRKNQEREESRKNIQITLERLGKAYEELKTSQAKILQQEKMASIGQLAAGVAHEINNPMAFIASNLGTLDKYIHRLIDFIQTQSEVIKSLKDADAIKKLGKKRKELKLDYVIEDVKGLITESLDGSERVQKIVLGLNRFSRVDEEEYKDADINECIESAINIVWNELKYKSTLKKDYGKLPRTKCYPQQINQVFINLLINAVNSIEEQGTITIKTWNKDRSIWMIISDTGCGIPQERLSKIFEPFFTTKDVGKGTGLGLSITYEIVQRHKGDITVESEVGKGTTFTIRIPVV